MNRYISNSKTAPMTDIMNPAAYASPPQRVLPIKVPRNAPAIPINAVISQPSAPLEIASRPGISNLAIAPIIKPTNNCQIILIFPPLFPVFILSFCDVQKPAKAR